MLKISFYVKRKGHAWERYPIARTDHPWPGSHITKSSDVSLVAYLSVGKSDGNKLFYGGGDIEEWISRDDGESWSFSKRIASGQGLLFNNPRPVENIDGGELPGYLVFSGWEGPDIVHLDIMKSSY